MKKTKIKLSEILSKWRAKKLTAKEKKLDLKKNEETIDNRLKILSDYVGRKLTINEEEAVLTIVDRYTPKDKDGDYLFDLLPFNYAWQIYETKKGRELDKFMGKLEVDLQE